MKITKKAIARKPEKTPRISVNKLAEYLEANSSRRKQIVFDAKYPKSFKTTRYKDARPTIKEYLLSEFDETLILDLIDELSAKKPDSDYQESDIRTSIESLESLLECDLSVFDGCEILKVKENNELINISGLDISINPDLMVKRIAGGIANVGAIKLHLSKSNLLSDESQKIVSMLLYKYVETFFIKKGEVPNIKLCLSFDIFGQSVECCTSSFTMRMKKVSDACEEILLWWEKL